MICFEPFFTIFIIINLLNIFLLNNSKIFTEFVKHFTMKIYKLIRYAIILLVELLLYL